MQAVLKDMETRMNAALDGLSREFATVRTGRASTALLDGIRVDYYGNPTPISQMATVSTPDARTLMVQPWEAGQIGAIEKAIQKSDLGLSPVNDGKLIRLSLPAPTEERRKQLVKSVAKMAEDARVIVATSAARPTTSSRSRPRTRRSPRTRSGGRTIRSRRPPTGSSPRSTSC